MGTAISILLLFFVIASAFGILAIVAALITYPIWTPRLAKRNLLVTIVEEGTGKWIMRNGKAWRFITSRAEKDPHPLHCDVTDEGLAEHPNPGMKLRTTDGENSVEPWWVDMIDRLLPGGMRWVGIPWIYSIYEYNFRWSVLRENRPLSTEDGLVEVDELESEKFAVSFAKRIDYVFLRDSVYYFRVSDAETQGADSDATDKSVGMAIALDLLATIRVTNPYLAFFVVHDWLETSLDLTRPSLRSWVAHRPYQEVNRKTESAQRKFDEFLRQYPAVEGDKCILDYLEETYGVRYKRIAFDAVIPPEEYAKAVNKRAEAVQNAVYIKTIAQANSEQEAILAQGKAKAISTIADAEAQRILKVNAALKDGGETAFPLRALEAYETMGQNGNTIVVGGNNPVQMLIDSTRRPISPSQPPTNPPANPQPQPIDQGGNQ
ncbi:MAG TPA: SPFH domain-containing protein [Candidatus Paceibacterota bacterium]|nr:SPFH domain-containing protein [Candidatus Paceibacterota bacterium]